MPSKSQKPVADDIAISVDSLTKTYRLFNHPGDRIKQFLSFGLKHHHRSFTALSDVSFDIRKGETVGIIGRNGSGKSTLLQLCCGILTPTAGSVCRNGRVSALLELGAGFNPEFTGRENVYFQGALTGFNKSQMDERFAEIASFAGIGEFIDEPVRTYSSGMFVRLAFAVAINVDPEILIVDEALGVGDAEFQERSISRMKSMQTRGATILFVSHSIPAVRNFCQRAIWLDKGVIRQIGPAGEVCQAYQSETESQLAGLAPLSFDTESPRKHPSGQPKLISLTHVAGDQASISVGDALTLHFDLHFSEAFKTSTAFGIGVIIRNDAGRLVSVLNTVRDDLQLSGRHPRISLELPRTAFVPGRYWLSVNVCDGDVLFAYDERERCLYFDVAGTRNRQGIPRWEGELACEHTWRV